MKEAISKSDWLTVEKCMAMDWSDLRTTKSQPTEAELFRIQEGQEIGALAGLLSPAAVLVSGNLVSAPPR